MKKIPLTQGKFALVDDEDFEELNKYNWYANERGYVMTSTGIYLHRLILIPREGFNTDHIDGNSLNNQRSNLRYTTVQQNLQNTKAFKNCKSKYKGVSLHKTSNLWRSRITLTNIFNQQFVHSLGYFDNEEEAAKAYDKAARQEHGEFGRYNFPRKNEQSAL